MGPSTATTGPSTYKDMFSIHDTRINHNLACCQVSNKCACEAEMRRLAKSGDNEALYILYKALFYPPGAGPSEPNRPIAKSPSPTKSESGPSKKPPQASTTAKPGVSPRNIKPGKGIDPRMDFDPSGLSDVITETFRRATRSILENAFTNLEKARDEFTNSGLDMPDDDPTPRSRKEEISRLATSMMRMEMSLEDKKIEDYLSEGAEKLAQGLEKEKREQTEKRGQAEIKVEVKMSTGDFKKLMKK